jgi:hypothetical protein
VTTDPLAALTVLDETGAAIKVDSLWQGGTVVLALVRHFG